jgi:hypothetical protein
MASFTRLTFAAVLGLILAGGVGAADDPPTAGGAEIGRLALPAQAAEPAVAAAEVDRLLREEVPGASATALQTINDQNFLRRVALDIIGRNPTPDEITEFVLDSAADKRAQVVERLLADERFGLNWGRYWRDVILYRKTEERAPFLIAQPLLTYFQTEFNKNSPWSKIATDMITATGDALENGACGLIVAQQGMPEDVTAEVSRIFLGVQIQCAQCHDHPTDRWKREQFHELAAFFPRIASRVILTQEQRSITVVANDNPSPFGRRPMNANFRFRGTPEHYMSDLQNPQARGKLMTPVLFATGQKLPLGTPDSQRRGTLAEWITAKDNPFFAKAFVNRMWSELVGEGFYEPVDDIGPDRQASAPQTLEYLAGQFAANGYDIKWLFKTITATKAYQMPAGPRRNPEQPPFQANVSQRLRADQIFDNLMAALGVDAEGPALQRGGPMAAGRQFRGGPRAVFSAVFGYDPSERREEIQTSIPQALALMNSPTINGAIRAGGFGFGGTALGRLVRQMRDDRALVTELYLRTLAREPSSDELNTCLAYVRQAGSRSEAFEDIQWSLINSTEFLHRN